MVHHERKRAGIVQKLEVPAKQVSKDPVTGRPLEYTPSTGPKFILCTDFSARNPDEYKDIPYEFWQHLQGHKCFEFQAGGQIPQAPYFYY